MNSLLFAIGLIGATAMIAAGLVAVLTRGTVVAILASGLVSLFASVLFVLLAAPDVAMTEAAIGSGLTTFFFFFVLGRIRREGGNG